MFKLVFLVCSVLLAFVAAKPDPLLYPYSAYSAPVAAAYTAPVAYSAYSAPLAYSSYSYASPYAYYLR